MGADVSRVRFDPLDDFSSVVLQQGRLLLDGDFNEYVAMLDRRLRAETCDLTSFGPDAKHQGVAWVPRLTPDAFRVAAAGGALSIGRGRMYVDGLVAENHGTGQLAYDPLLGELTGTADTLYNKQPYWPEPDPLPAGGTHLAYLDVWEREITHIEDPGLVEVAVGVDTTARTQTVWQVRLLADIPSSTTCATDDDDIPGWLDVISPSAGRLTTGTVTVDEKDDPCALPPSSGYRGLENQTYRVEVHTGGAPGTATFKWSRENASVVQPVLEMLSPTELRLASLGRDDKLNIGNDDWVEILDDRYELAGGPGVMRKVTVDDAKRTIAFVDPLPADLQPADANVAAVLHLRARRWDQSKVVRNGLGAPIVDLDAAGSAGVITVPTNPLTEVVLEHGVAVSFATAAGGTGRFRAGDHWIFAARTDDTSVDVLTAAPPLGVHHHYARLGIVTFPDSETSCRRLWPPEATDHEDCACTVCVTTDPNSVTLQEAIEQVRTTGGTICVAAGVHDLGDGVTIDEARSVRIRGQGTATVLVARGTAVRITRSFGIVLESMAIVSGAGGAAGVAMSSVVATTLEDLVVLSYNADANGGGGTAVGIEGVSLLVALRRNVLVGRTGVQAGNADRGIFAAGLRIEDNVVTGVRAAIDLGRRSMFMYACRVTGNDLLGGRTGAVVADGVVRPGGSLDIARNKILNEGPGIVAGCDVAIECNTIGARGGKPAGEGIVIAPSALTARPGHVRILANRVHGRSGAAVALRTRVSTFIVKQNVLGEVGAGIVFEDKAAAENVAIENNQLLDVAGAEGGERAAFGILVGRAGAVTVAGNSVARFAPLLQETRMRVAIAVVGCRAVRISGNVVEETGSREDFLGLAVGILAVGPSHHIIASENSVQPAAIPTDGRWHALLVASAGAELLGLGPQNASVPTGKGAVVLSGNWAAFIGIQRDGATITSNVLEGGGEVPTCIVRVRGDVIAEANHCTHVQGEVRAMVLGADSIAASSNRIRGGDSMLILEADRDRFAAVGNLAPSGTHLGGPGDGLPGPWQALNPNVP